MTYFLSTGLAAAIAGTDSLLSAMNNGVIVFYSGAVPASADASVGSATQIGQVLLNGTDPLELMHDGTMVRKPNGVVWECTPLATGAASFYRHVLDTDTGEASTTEKRIQGTVGLTNAANMTLADINFTSGVAKQLATYSVRMPNY